MALQQKIEMAIQNNVPEVVKTVMIEQIQLHVYNVYQPKEYVRQYELINPDNIETTNVPMGVSIRNIRSDEDAHYGDYRDVARVVEEGGPYVWNVYIDERPFTQKTRDRLIASRVHVNAVRNGLKEQGLRVE